MAAADANRGAHQHFSRGGLQGVGFACLGAVVQGRVVEYVLVCVLWGWLSVAVGTLVVCCTFHVGGYVSVAPVHPNWATSDAVMRRSSQLLCVWRTGEAGQPQQLSAQQPSTTNPSRQDALMPCPPELFAWHCWGVAPLMCALTSS